MLDFSIPMKAAKARVTQFPNPGNIHGFLGPDGTYYDINHLTRTHMRAMGIIAKATPGYSDPAGQSYTPDLDHYIHRKRMLLPKYKAVRIYGDGLGGTLNIESHHALTNSQLRVLSAAVRMGWVYVAHDNTKNGKTTYESSYVTDKIGLGRTLRLGRPLVEDLRSFVEYLFEAAESFDSHAQKAGLTQRKFPHAAEESIDGMQHGFVDQHGKYWDAPMGHAAHGSRMFKHLPAAAQQARLGSKAAGNAELASYKDANDASHHHKLVRVSTYGGHAVITQHHPMTPAQRRTIQSGLRNGRYNTFDNYNYHPSAKERGREGLAKNFGVWEESTDNADAFEHHMRSINIYPQAMPNEDSGFETNHGWLDHKGRWYDVADVGSHVGTAKRLAKFTGDSKPDTVLKHYGVVRVSTFGNHLAVMSHYKLTAAQKQVLSNALNKGGFATMIHSRGKAAVEAGFDENGPRATAINRALNL